MTPEEQVAKNLGHAFEFLEAAVREPSTLDNIPNGANIVLCPDGDQELTQANLAMIERQLAKRGKLTAAHPRQEPGASDATLVLPVSSL